MPYSSVMNPNFTPIDPSKFKKTVVTVDGVPSPKKTWLASRLIVPGSLAIFLLSVSAFVGTNFYNYITTNSQASNAAFEDNSSLVTTLKKARSADEVQKEKQILDAEAAKLNIDLSYDEIRERLLAEAPDIATSSAFPNALTSMKYVMLRERIIQKEIESSTAYVLGFWTPPLNYPGTISTQQKQFYEKARQEGIKALPDMEKQLKDGTDPLDIVKNIAEKYPDLKPIIGLNGRLLSKSTTDYFFMNPHIYAPGDISIKQKLYSALFNSKTGDIKTVVDDTGTGSAKWLVKIVESNHSNYKSYDDWLDVKLKESLSLPTPTMASDEARPAATGSAQ